MMKTKERSPQTRKTRKPFSFNTASSPLPAALSRAVQWLRYRTLRVWEKPDPAASMALETLEPRLLLSADLSFTAASAADLTLKVEQVDGVDTLQLVETQNPSNVVAWESLSNIDGSSGYGAQIDGNGFDITLRIDDSAEGSVIAGVRFVGGVGTSTLVGPDLENLWNITGAGDGTVGSVTFSGVEFIVGGTETDTVAGPAADTVWNITGSGEGDVAGVHFANVENLQGAADNQDTFVVSGDGAIDGTIDGNDGGFDTLVMDGGTFDSVTYTAFGPNSGTIERDGSLLRYDGLEPMVDLSIVANRIFNTSTGPDAAVLSDDGFGNYIIAGPGFESLNFAAPTNSLTINLGTDGGALDTLTVNSFTAPGVDLTVNGDAGLDIVTFLGPVTAGDVVINAEIITVDTAGSISGGNITLNATAAVGSMLMPDDSPLANVIAIVNVAGNLTGNNILLNANASLVSSVTNLPQMPSTATLAANVWAEVSVNANAIVTATGTFTATALANVDSTSEADAIITMAGELAIAAPVINVIGRSGVSGNATINAGGAVTIDAETNTTVNTTADGSALMTTTGTTTATPILLITTEAFIAGTADVTASTDIAITATANSTIVTTAISTPDGSLPSAEVALTLADLGAATSAGPQTDAAAIAATTIAAYTRAFISTTGSIVTSGDVTIFADSHHNIHTEADARTSIADMANASAIATNLTTIIDQAFIGGNLAITADSVDIGTGGGSTLTVLAQSGSGGKMSANAGINAGSLAINTNIPIPIPPIPLPMLPPPAPPAPPTPPPPATLVGDVSEAFINTGTLLTLGPNTDLTIHAANSSFRDSSAEPNEVNVGSMLGTGRSAAANLSAYTTQASIRSGAQITGGRNVDVTADGDQMSQVTAYSGALAQGESLSIAAAISFTNNSTVALVDTGTSMNLTGALLVEATHQGLNLTRADADAFGSEADPSTALATPVAVNLGNDSATAMVDGAVSAVGGVDVLANAVVENQADTVSGSAGTADDGTLAADRLAAETAFLQDRAALTFGSAPAPATENPTIGNVFTSQGTAAAAAISGNLSNAAATAGVGPAGNLTVTGGSLNVISISDIDSIATASSEAITDLIGIGAAIALNAHTANTIASISGAVTADGVEVTANSSDQTLLA
ncbi:MAG TPA: LEPR-XLL domain-containing protein, partial [Terriglobia bacterium]|nr:LEPR-XLL domain-containing protein [Terriglobia bacterium]